MPSRLAVTCLVFIGVFGEVTSRGQTDRLPRPGESRNSLAESGTSGGSGGNAAPMRPAKRAPVFLPAGPTDAEFPHLHNLFQVTELIYSGGEPKNEQAFAELAELGVKVIVSVDGAPPKVDLAKKYGMRYIHIPIGYDGIDSEAVASFARVADEVEAKAYVHCHHGTHRGPAGAAAICVAHGDVDGERAVKILEKAGTSKGYAGLWRDVRNYRRPAADAELPELVAVAEVESLAAAMAQIDRACDNLKLCRAADWLTPTNHPDVSPRQEALLLKEGFRETVRRLAEANDDERFVSWMRASEDLATRLETALQGGDRVAASAAFAKLQDRCKECHGAYRH